MFKESASLPSIAAASSSKAFDASVRAWPKPRFDVVEIVTR
ncbi:secreted protein [Rhodopirellula sp. SWK7]|nr:secreted protein [Rhodopirellula sp. SWK7]